MADNMSTEPRDIIAEALIGYTMSDNLTEEPE